MSGQNSETVIVAAALGGWTLPAVATDLTSEDFDGPMHRRIWRAVIDLRSRGAPTDLPSVATYLEDVGEANATAILSGAMELMAGTLVLPTSIEWHAKRVQEESLRRKLKVAGQALIDDDNDDAAERLGRLQERLRSLTASTEQSGPVHIRTIMAELVAHIFDPPDPDIHGIVTGLDHVDRLMRGMRPGEYVVLASRPSVGKTALALHIARQAIENASAPGGTLIFSLDMPAKAIAIRILAAMVGINSTKIEDRRLTEAESTQISGAGDWLAGLAITIDDSALLTVEQIRTRVAKHVEDYGPLALLIVDHLQLVKAGRDTGGNPTHEVTMASEGLRAIGKESGCPILVVSQLRRIEGQPKLDHLRQSGSIEQDADKVLLLHRWDYQDEACPNEMRGVVQVHLAKNRNGQTGRAYVVTDPTTGRFETMTLARAKACGIESDGMGGWFRRGGRDE